MQTLWNKAENLTKGIENKALKIVAFWTALTGLFALIPTFFGFIYGIYVFGTHLYNLDTYVTEITAINEYQNFQIKQLTNMIQAEADAKKSFGIPVRMTNPPKVNGKPAGQGDLWYFTYIKINNTWRPITYGAFPYVTDSKVGILDMHGEYGEAGKEPHPDKEEIEILHRHH